MKLLVGNKIKLDEFVKAETQKLADFYYWYQLSGEEDLFKNPTGHAKYPVEMTNYEWDLMLKVYKAKNR